METNFNFNSQVCTSRSQSERLLALGLKKETADMCWTKGFDESYYLTIETYYFDDDIPAWSLHRLIEMVEQTKFPYRVISKELPIYDALCDRIRWLIKEGYFNKEYLEE